MAEEAAPVKKFERKKVISCPAEVAGKSDRNNLKSDFKLTKNDSIIDWKDNKQLLMSLVKDLLLRIYHLANHSRLKLIDTEWKPDKNY